MEHNLNKGFYKDLDTNFEQALELIERDYSHSELIELLIAGNIPEKQMASLKLECLKSIEDADILVSNLTGCDGKIREAVALKINYLLNRNDDYINYFKDADIFAMATIDINGNICRLVIDSVALLLKNKDFASRYIENILQIVNDSFQELDKFIYRDKKYVINKQLFKLYWGLEALKLFAKDLPCDILYPILDRASKEKEYTIREQVARIVVELEPEMYSQIISPLINDSNYYVREVFSNYKYTN